MRVIRQLFTHNIGLKLFSLFLAFFIWRAIASGDVSEVGFTVPLELRNIPEGAAVVGDVVNSVNVRVRSSSEILKRLSSADMLAFLDLSGVSMGERTYPLAANNVQVPVGVEVVHVVPTHVKLTLEKTVDRMVPVNVRVRGNLAGLGELLPQPAQVRIQGPESHVKLITQVNTDYVNPEDFSSERKISISLAVEDPTIRLSQESVVVQVVPPPQMSAAPPG
ncbi:MAG: CdaR family protein [Acidobacteriia bacterium]|nr:CdaR family protein [Terriglobia bacterium]